MRIIKIPYSGGALEFNKDCKNAPDIIVKELENIWCNENNKEISLDVASIGEDLEFKNLFVKIKNVTTNTKTIFLGGDHSITLPCFKVFAENFNGSKALVIFDAHPDVFQEFEEPSHGDYLKFIVESNIVNPANIFIIGLRNWHESEMEYLKKKNIKFYTMKNIYMNGIEDTTDAITELLSGFDNIYVSIDIDCLDPAFAPGTGLMEPGGFSSRDLLYMIQRINLLNVKMLDIVEVSPIKDINNMTSKLAAKLIIEFS